VNLGTLHCLFSHTPQSPLVENSRPARRALQNHCCSDELAIQHPGIALALPPGVSELPVPAQHAEVRATGDETAPVLMVPDSGLSIEDIERAAIVFALERTRGNRSQAARFLTLSRSALLYRMRKHRISIPHQS
jgi:transcriptional regulator of acetoin/glycerol metabolism